MPTFDEEKQEKRLAELRAQEEEELMKMLSQKYGISYIDLSQTSIDTDALQLVKEDAARAAELAPFQKVGKKLSVAIRTPNSNKVPPIIEELERRGYTVTKYLVSSASLERAWSRYKDITFTSETKAGILDISGEDIQAMLKSITSLEEAKQLISELLGQKKAYRISRILETVLAGGLAMSASDIHIEPAEENIRLRFRLDGVLTDVLSFDRETYGLLLSRIKLLSGLKLNIKDKAQDGRFSVQIDQSEIEIRTSILPGSYGESIVLRLLDPATIALPMEALGIESKLLSILEREIKKPNGMLLTTGPTGSGKTTTLYAFMRKVHTPQIKIITIEDPVEYHLEGIVQTQVDPKKYTFAQGLRSALRQDPDVIMVGEIRDSEVATTAINASLTGHLVFSTLHTNTAAGAFPRLIDLGVNPKVISSAVNVAMAQRLVRKLCESCRREVDLTPEQKQEVERVLAGIKDRSLVPDVVTKAYEAVGCDQCNESGYKGRVGIFEAILLDEAIEKLIVESASERDIAEAAHEQGILTMLEDGIIKVLRGVTSFEELERVIEVDAETTLPPQETAAAEDTVPSKE